MAEWTFEENQLILKNLKKYEEYVKTLRRGDIMDGKLKFGTMLHERYPDIFHPSRKTKDIHPHCDHMLKLVYGKYTPNQLRKIRPSDIELYFNIWNEDQTESDKKQGKSPDFQDNEMKVSRSEEKLEIDESHIKKLLPWFGYGYFREAQLVFWGNEEGLGGYPIEAVLGRCELYGNDPDTWIDGAWENGYWDETGHEGYVRLGEVTNEIRRNRGLPPSNKEKNLYSSFLDFQARILLSMESPNIDWFQPYSWYEHHDPDRYKLINDKINHLYHHNSSVKAGLIDWRPLPRPNEELWPYVGIDQKQYEDAFGLKEPYYSNVKKALNGEVEVEALDNYSKMLMERVILMKKVLYTFPFQLLISSGDIEAKEKLIKLIFQDQEIAFQELTLNPNKRYKKAEIQLGSKKLTIILSLFFNHRANCLTLEGLKELFLEEIHPMMISESTSV